METMLNFSKSAYEFLKKEFGKVAAVTVVILSLIAFVGYTIFSTRNELYFQERESSKFERAKKYESVKENCNRFLEVNGQLYHKILNNENLWTYPNDPNKKLFEAFQTLIGGYGQAFDKNVNDQIATVYTRLTEYNAALAKPDKEKLNRAASEAKNAIESFNFGCAALQDTYS